MFLVSNYPQVPIATTNPATDSAEVDAKLRMPVPVTEAMEKTGAERAINSEHERSEVRRRQQQQQGNGETSAESDASEEQQLSERALSWKERLAQANPTFERPTLKRDIGDNPSLTDRGSLLRPDDYERFSAVVTGYYGDAAQPKGAPDFRAAT